MNKGDEVAERDTSKTTHQRALRNALLEFVTVFLSELCWNFFRKTGGSVLDFFGIAALTALFLYFFHREN